MSARAARTAAYAACAWSVLFLVPHVYWAAGGTGGLPDGDALEGLVAAINYAAIALSVAAAALALSLLPQRPPAPRRLLLAGAWSASLLLGVRGAGGLLQGLIDPLGGSDEGSERFVIAFEGLFLLGGDPVRCRRRAVSSGERFGARPTRQASAGCIAAGITPARYPRRQ